ncbi:RelA/SpoT domain-containing protein [Pectobacterium parmentieri]|uniref:RelA/SpoT domain-containing protein n=1 Tax=Pectobacterium parmentieri TaxID=1905730 RepID=UPI0004735ECD|nr:RelA/SpoT domain-containing protein [Pectobacterium parmentieri]
MGYNQSKNAALNETHSLNMRYKALLRCISYVCKVESYKFPEMLKSIDTGLNEGLTYDAAAEKIRNCIPLLDSKRSGVRTVSVRDNAVVEVLDDDYDYDHDGEGISTYYKRKIINRCKTFKFLKWKVLFGIKRVNSKPLSKEDMKHMFHVQFRDFSPLFESIAFDLALLLSKKLKHIDSKLAFQPQYRNKTWDSVASKITRMSININSLMDMQDLIGLRVVTVFEKDLFLVENVIENSFKIMRRYKPNYLAVDGDTFAKHFIIQVSTQNACNYMDDKPPFLLAEIQIMTLTQFTFASLSHSLLYKNELNNSSVKDSLARISTLLNEVDSEINEKIKK